MLLPWCHRRLQAQLQQATAAEQGADSQLEALVAQLQELKAKKGSLDSEARRLQEQLQGLQASTGRNVRGGCAC